MSITTLFSIYPDESFQQLIKVYKIQIGTFMTLILIRNREEVNKLLWVITLSIGFFGIKGGIFTISTGGGHRVWGPPSTYIEGNNELALALLMIIPLFLYLKSTVSQVWVKRAINISVLLCCISAIGSYSRGAFLALIAMMFMLWLKTSNKIISGTLALIFFILVFSFMPEQYFSRLDTINTYEQDSSAMSRINAWLVAMNVASDRFFGGGFNFWSDAVFAQYTSTNIGYQAAHSIYFSVLGEHGFIGLFLFLLFFFLTWRNASFLIKAGKDNKANQWAGILARMIQVSLIAYASGGAFLSLSYFDLPYHLAIILVIVRSIIERSEESSILNKTIKLPETSNNIARKWPWEK